MKKKIIILALFIFALNLQAQKLIKGVVSDSVYQTPVPYAAVFVQGERYAVSADNVGEFSLSVPDSIQVDTLIVAAEGFELKRFGIAETDDVSNLFVDLVVDISKQQKATVFKRLDKSSKPFFRFASKAAQGVINDWLPLGNPETNKFDFGRIQPSVTLNDVEGLRLRPGIASNSRLNPHFFVKGYLAYGFKDKKVKYRGEAIYSFSKKAYHENEFPKNNLRFVSEYDVYSPGDLHPRAENDFLLSTYRRAFNQMTYRNFWDVSYERETKSGIASTVWFRKSIYKPQGEELNISPRVENIVNPQKTLNVTEVGALVRYSVREAYEQTKRKRKTIELLSPVFFAGYLVGSYNAIDGRQFYSRLELSAQKRFQLNRFGRLDMVAEFGKVWNRVPIPLLLYPNQRHKHIIENPHFFLTQAMEFPADEQYTLRSVFVGDKLLFSYIPILNKLRFRELVGFKVAYGKLNENTYPKDNLGMYSLPPMSARYDGVPYVEGSIGITNMLGVARMEYVHRFTHRAVLGAILGRIRFVVAM